MRKVARSIQDPDLGQRSQEKLTLSPPINTFGSIPKVGEKVDIKTNGEYGNQSQVVTAITEISII